MNRNRVILSVDHCARTKAKRAMGKPRSHLLDVYDCWVHVATDRRQLATLRQQYGPKSIPKQDEAWFGGTTQFRVEPIDGPDINHYVVYIDIASHRGNGAEIVNTCAHEATHAAALILDATSTEYDGNSEPLAWLVGWLTRWIWLATT